MSHFRIFTESKADIKFLKDYIGELFQISLTDDDFDPLLSWSGYKSGGGLIASIQENTFNGKRNILVLDADKNIEQRRKEVLDDFHSYGIPVNLFLFPNDLDNGNIESLLAEVATNRKIMECFLEYENCVSGNPKPLNDARIYSYLDLLLHPDPIFNKIDLRKDEFRDYTIKDHWDLTHDSLDALKKFLTPLL